MNKRYGPSQDDLVVSISLATALAILVLAVTFMWVWSMVSENMPTVTTEREVDTP